MTELLRLSQGAFLTFNGHKFHVGHVDAPYRVHEIGQQVVYILATLAEPTDLVQLLSKLKVSDELRQSIGRFFDQLHADGVLTAEAKSFSPSPPDLKKTIFEIARATEVQSDIGRLFPDFRNAWRKVESECLSSMPLGLALWNSCRHITKTRVPGAIVECGVWQGASMVLAALALKHFGPCDRTLYLYDIFDWSWEAPVGADGFFMSDAEREIAKAEPALSVRTAPTWEHRIIQKLVDAGHPRELVHTVRGRVQETLPSFAPEAVAILRLDTDYYDSTLHELEHLYPRLSPGGILLVDDYGRLEGATRAVDEYFAKYDVPMMLHRIDSQGCIGVKLS